MGERSGRGVSYGMLIPPSILAIRDPHGGQLKRQGSGLVLSGNAIGRGTMTQQAGKLISVLSKGGGPCHSESDVCLS